MRIARRDRFEAGLMQPELRLPTLILEGQRQDGLGTSWISLRIGPAPDHHEPLRRYDLAIDALRPMITVGPEHVDSISAARAQLVFKHGALEVARTEPIHHVFGLGPRLEHERAGRIEDALDSEFTFGHLRSSISSTHFYFL